MHIVFDLDQTLIDSIPISQVISDSRYHYSDLDTFPIGTEYIAFVRPFARQFIQQAIDHGNDISIWTRANKEYAYDVARWFMNNVDGLTFKYIYCRDKCPIISGIQRKPLSYIDGDLLIDDNPENELSNEDRFLQCEEFYALNSDDFFLKLFNIGQSYNDWDSSIFV